MEVLVQLDNLLKIFLLHLGPSHAHLARILREKHLVDHDIADVDVELRQLLDQPFSLVHRKELRDADCHEGRLGVVFHVLVDSPGGVLHLLHFREHLADGIVEFLLGTEDPAHARHYRAELLLQREDLIQPLLQDVGEVPVSYTHLTLPTIRLV